MKEHMRKDIIFICSFVGYLMDKNKFDWDNTYVNLQKQKVIDQALLLADLLSNIADKKEFDKIYNEIKDGLYVCDVLCKQELIEHKKRNLKTRVKVELESVHDLAEFAMGNNCGNCKANKKACRLRKALLKAGIPGLNEKRGECEYLWNL